MTAHRAFEVAGRIVRRAGTSDAEALAAFAAASFTETFGFNYPPEDLATFLSETCSTAATAKVLEDPRRDVWIARDAAGAIAGYVDFGPLGLPVTDPEPNAWELKRLYVAPSAKGTGLAQALAGLAPRAVGLAAVPALYLGVWSLNPRAIRFYEKLGFEVVGAYRFKVGATLDDELIMRLAIEPAGEPIIV